MPARPSSSRLGVDDANANLDPGSWSTKSKAYHDPYLSKSSTSNSTSTSFNAPEDSTPGTPTHPHGGGLMAQLHHLIPRHALFHACVQIHQISSVPLVHGEFGVRWKFKHTTTQPVPKHGAIFRLAEKEKEKRRERREKGKGKADESHNTATGEVDDALPSIPSVIVSSQGEHGDSTVSVAGTLRTASSSSSSSLELSSRLPSSTSVPSSSSLNPSSSATSTSRRSGMSKSQPPAPCNHNPLPPPSAPRGITPFLPLKEHSVTWSHTLHTTVKLAISRPGASSTNNTATDNTAVGVLLPNPLKLVVMQRVIPGDPDAPKNPRLGALYLDLAEYASVKGGTTRRYLLRESKTNATLKLTITMTQIGGDTNFTAPSLPKGEILNGISGLLENDVYKTRPRALDLFGPYYNYNQPETGADTHEDTYNHYNTDDTSDGGSHEDGYDSPSNTGHSITRPSSRSGLHRHGSLFQSHKRTPSHSKQTPNIAPVNARRFTSKIPDPSAPFDVAHLPFAYGPKTTETLIEALFNPVPRTIPSTDVTQRPATLGMGQNPFVYYMEKGPDDNTHEHDYDMTIGRTHTSTYPNAKHLFPKMPASEPTIPRPSILSEPSIKGSTASSVTVEVDSVYSVSTSSSSMRSGSGSGSNEGGSLEGSVESRSNGGWLKITTTKKPTGLERSTPSRSGYRKKRNLNNEDVESVVGIVVS